MDHLCVTGCVTHRSQICHWWVSYQSWIVTYESVTGSFSFWFSFSKFSAMIDGFLTFSLYFLALPYFFMFIKKIVTDYFPWFSFFILLLFLALVMYSKLFRFFLFYKNYYRSLVFISPPVLLRWHFKIISLFFSDLFFPKIAISVCLYGGATLGSDALPPHWLVGTLRAYW